MLHRKISKRSIWIGLLFVVLSLIMVVPVSVQAQSVKFVVAGDTRGDDNGVNTAILGEIAAATISEGADFILIPGDLVNGSSTQVILESQLTTWRTTMQPLYDAGIGVYPCRGNHDTGSKAAWDAVFTGAYALPSNGPGGEENITFSFTHSNVFIVGLDEYGSHNKQVNQTWLDAQFSSNTQPHVFVFGHEPAFDVVHSGSLSAYPTERNAFWDSIVAEGGRTYFAGHDHVYNHARIDDGDGDPDNDAHQVVAATAGAPLYDWSGTYGGNTGSWTPQLVHHEKQFGYVLVEIDGLDVTLTWKHRTAEGAYEPGGDVFSYSVASGPPANWTSYIDLRAEAGDSNHANVLKIVPTGPDTQPIDPAVDWVLKDFASGADLPVTMSVDMAVRYPTTNGADSAAGTDADQIFGGIVDGVGGYEIDLVEPGDYVTLTFDNLDPTKEYIVAVTNNRDNTEYTNRATMFTIDADTYANASSTVPPPGVVVNGLDSVSFSTGNNSAAGYVAKWTGVTAADGSFSITAVQDTSVAQGWDGSKGYAMTSIMLQEVPSPPVNWTSYIDLRAEAGDSNHANVLKIVPTGPDTQPINPAVDWVLKDFASGADLPVTMSVDMAVRYPTTNGADSAAGTDADQIFGGIVDGVGGYEIDLVEPGDYVTLTFDNLDPTKEYIVAVTNNRDNTEYTNRATMFTIDADTYTNASSTVPPPGVVVNGLDSVSFSTGNNSAAGYVAKWTGVTAADGSFSITAVQDTSVAQGWDGSKGYAMTSIMLQEVGEPPEENLSIYLVGSGSVTKIPYQVEYYPDDVVELTAVPDTGWQFIGWSGDLSGTTNPQIITVTGGMVITANFAPENWTAYIDLNAQSGDSNDSKVLAIVPTGPDTQPIDPAVDWVLKDFASGADLPVTMSVDMAVRYPTTNGADSAAGTDADQIFGGIVDGVGGYEIDLVEPGDYVTLTFDNLDPTKEYIVAVTNNRDNTEYTNRATMFTIDADTYTNASSTVPPPGVVVNGLDSVSFSTGNNSAAGYVAKWTGVTAADGSFSITAVQDTSVAQGWDGSKGYAMTSIMLQEVPSPPVNWTSYIDLRAEAGDSNHANVLKIVPTGPDTQPINPAVDWVLKDFASGADLPVTMSVDMAVRYPTTNGADSAAGTDADQIFGGIVDGVGGYEIDLVEPGDYVTLTFDNLDPTKEYIVAVTNNRDNTEYTNRATMFTIDADTYTNASSTVPPPGVVVNGLDSVSFSTGNNSAAGYVAKWTGVTAADGSFSITAVQDTSVAQEWDGSKGYAMTSIMLQEVPPPPEGWKSYIDLRAEAGDSNHANVLKIVPTGPDTQPIDPAVDWVLKDFAFGANLPVTMSVDMAVRYPTTNGADSAAGTDADQIFGGIVDGVGGYEIDLVEPGDYVTLTFDNLDPTKEYIVAVTYNRDNTEYTNRATMFTIDADTYTNASSTVPPPGVVVNGLDSVSFSTGNNSAAGYVAKWTGVTAADGSFSITAVQDTSVAQEWDGSKGYAMTSIMLQEGSGGPLPCYALTLGHNGQGSDPVASPTNSTDCALGQYVTGESITLSGALPAADWEINSWSNTDDDASTADTNTVTMPAGGHSVAVNYVALPPPSGGVSENFESGFTPDSTIGNHPDWYDGGNGPVVTPDIGVAGSVGLAPANNIFTWITQCVDWNDPDFQSVTLQMDFETDSAGEFDDDRLVLNIDSGSVLSTDVFGVQLDHSDGGIVTYWRNGEDRIQDQIVDLAGWTTANTWYRFEVQITKLTATSASLDVSLVELDALGMPTGTPKSSTVEDTSQWGGGSRAPDERYFTGSSMCAAYKNYNGCDNCEGAADNAHFEAFYNTSVVWTAYNDLAAFSNTTPTGNFTFITTPDGGNVGLPVSGELVKFADGTGTGVTLSVTGGLFNGGSHVDTHTGSPTSGDAAAVFSGIPGLDVGENFDATGTISYNVSNDLVLTLTGMKPDKRYNLVLYGHRNDYGWDRAALATLTGTGADGFTNESSPATDNPTGASGTLFDGPADASTRLPSDNDYGYVARFTNIDPGSDGEVLLTISYDGTWVDGQTDFNKGKYANAIMLQEGSFETVRFAAIGDYGDGSGDEGAVATLVDSKSPDFIVTTGDNSYGSNLIDVNIGQFYSDYIGDYIGVYGDGSVENRFFPSLGNHDYTDGGGINAYFNYFTLPGNERYYDFVQGPVHFFVIDSNPSGIGSPPAVGDGRSETSVQADWLQAQLAASTVPWKIVYMHHPPYSSSTSHGSETVMQWPYEEWGVTAVFAGHDHVYERIIRDDNSDGEDFAYFTTGAGGRSLYGFPTSGFIVGSQVRCGSGGSGGDVINSVSNCYGSMIIDASSTSITFEYWSIEDGGTLVDTYTIGELPGPTPTTVSFQEGVNGYSGTQDTFLQENAPGEVNGSDDWFEWDDKDPNTTTNQNFGLIHFANIFGDGPGQIPAGADIASATLTYTAFDPGVAADVREMLVSWDESGNLTSICGASCDDGSDYSTTRIATAASDPVGIYQIDVTSSLQSWADGSASNRGWIFVPPAPGADGGGAQIRSSEYVTEADRPKLTVRYNPAPATERPADPSDLAATAISASEVEVTWTDNSDNANQESSFEIEWSPNGTPSSFILIDTVPANTTSYTHSGLAPESQNCYQVRAVNSIGPSDYTTDLACATTPAGPATAMFQEGVNGYAGTVDTYIMEFYPASDYGGLESVEWDADDPSEQVDFYKYALIRFDNIFGPELGQIPEGANILSATLTYVVYNVGDPADVNEAATGWSEAETWNSFGEAPGVLPEDYGNPVGTADGDPTGTYSINVTSSLAAWSADPSANYGWIFRPTGPDGVDFRSSEYGVPAQRPKLTVVYSTGPVVYYQGFETYPVDSDPADWRDTEANNSMAEDPSLFKTYDVDGNMVFGTTSTATNIHSHYMGAGSDSLSGYVYTGRMMITSASGGIGVTFLSQYGPGGDDVYYRLRRYGSGDFYIEPHGTAVTGDINTGVVPDPNVWYRFEIEVEDTGVATEIRAKVWQEGEVKPDSWQVNAIDASSGRLTEGTFGVWSYSVGNKYWDDLTVNLLGPPPPQYLLDVTTVGEGSVAPAGGTYNEGTDVLLTATADPGWVFIGWSDDLTGSDNPATITMDADKNVTATFEQVQVYTLTVDIDPNDGAGTVTPDSPGPYEQGEVVQLTAVPADGWDFSNWSGDLNGTDETASILMDGDKVVTAIFNAPTLYALDISDVVGNGSVSADPAGPDYPAGTVVTLTAVPDSGWEFSEWSGALTGSDNPETITMDADKSVTVTFTFTPSDYAYQQDFEAYTAGDDPADWVDTEAKNSMVEDDSLFKTFDLSGEKVFGTTSTLANIHSHYVGDGSSTLTAYEYTGRMMMTDARSGIGVTILSQYSRVGGIDAYYRLRRYKNNSFHIEPHGTSITEGVTDTGVVPQPNDWYYFKIQAEDTGTRTEIRAKVWADGTIEPDGWQVDCYDASDDRLTLGTFGLWSYSLGSKYWDDLTVNLLGPPPPQYLLNVTTVGEGSVAPAGGTYNEGTDVLLTATPNSGYVFSEWSGALTGSDNPATITMDADKNVTATFEQVYTLTVNIDPNDGAGTVTPDSPGPYEQGEVVQLTAVPADGWTFSGWSGHLSGTNVTASITMDEDKVVTATFGAPTLYALDISDVVGSGSVSANPVGPMYPVGTVVTLTAVPDSGWEFSEWSGALTGSNNPETITMDADKSVTVTFTFTPSDYAYQQDFEAYTAGDDPADWVDTGAKNSMVEDDSLFQVFDLSGEKVFGTTSTLTNIHSHYLPDEDPSGIYIADSYEYTGRMMMTDAKSGIGVTFFSWYASEGEDAYYRLRRYKNNSFHIEPHGTSITGGISTDTGVVPQPNEWYWFKVQVKFTDTQTEILAKVWADTEGSSEPIAWQVDCYDDSPTRLTAGTIGVWSYSSGSKYWDDLAVEIIDVP